MPSRFCIVADHVAGRCHAKPVEQPVGVVEVADDLVHLQDFAVIPTRFSKRADAVFRDCAGFKGQDFGIPERREFAATELELGLPVLERPFDPGGALIVSDKVLGVCPVICLGVSAIVQRGHV